MSKLKKEYVQVVLSIPVEGPFTYYVPEKLRENIEIGKRVEVDFRGRKMLGFVVGFTLKLKNLRIKPIQKILDVEALLDKKMLALTKWLSNYYFSSWGEAIKATIPAYIKNRPLKITQVREKDSCGVKFEEIKNSLFFEEEQISLTSAQREQLIPIIDYLDKQAFGVFLLFDITSSGKHQIYMEAIKHTLELNKSCIVLVPEIILASQTKERLEKRFDSRVSILHSRIRQSERETIWRQINSGEIKIVIGPKSCVFAPVKNLGLIVVDDEHEKTYKQEEVPRYHARDVAIKRAELEGACVILGSSTPSLESYYNSKCGKYKLLSITTEIHKCKSVRRDLPEIEIVDMKNGFGRRNKRYILSIRLKQEIEKVINNHEQAILFLNRRGFSTYINCAKCGYVARCKKCNVSLNFHKNSNQLICHYCNFKEDISDMCPACRSSSLRHSGIGTQKVVSEVSKLFPEVKVARLDTDAIRKKDMCKEVLEDFKNGKIDILVGTQMIAKSLDFPKVSLVGIISADTALNLPDFRAEERTFSLLTQVAGKISRGETNGKVIIQTYNPSNFAICTNKDQIYEKFYNKEIKLRKQLKFPPITHIVNITLNGENEKNIISHIEKLAHSFEQSTNKNKLEILGPAPCVLRKIRKYYRWNILLKSKSIKYLGKILKENLKDKRSFGGVKITVDVDPQSIL